MDPFRREGSCGELGVSLTGGVGFLGMAEVGMGAEDHPEVF